MADSESMPPGIDPAIARVGRAVADRRLECGLTTQRELADKAGVALNTAAMLERGHTFPRAGNAHKIEQALDWPAGMLTALRRGDPLQTPAQPRAPAPATGGVHAVSIAQGVVKIAGLCAEVLMRQGSGDPDSALLLRGLSDQLLALETMIAASLPHAADAFDETVAALEEVHRNREALQSAVARSEGLPPQS